MGFWDKVKKAFGAGANGAARPPDEGAAQPAPPAPPAPAAPPPPAAAAPPPARQPRPRRSSGRTWRLTKHQGSLALIAPHGTFLIKGVTDDIKAAVAALDDGDEVVCEGDYDGGSSITELVVTKILDDPRASVLTRTTQVTAPVVAVAPPAATARPQPAARATSGAVSAGGGVQAAPPAPATTDADRYMANEILGLSAAELRKRALRITPWRTAWIGRVDTIPPQSDERTAIIDRGLILRGLLTEQQIIEIHQVGDLWLKYHEAEKIAASIAGRTADAAVEAERAKRAALKADKKKQAAEREAARVAAVQERRRTDIVFAGRGVSARLHDRRAHVEELTRLGLPVLASPADVARALGLSIPQLRWLCFHSEAAEKTHYVYFEVAKRSGGTRLLAAPHRKLGAAQRWVLDNILAKLDVTTYAHGFVAGRSTVTNATAHVGKDVVVNLDLKDFFPSVTFPRVRGVFESIGYSPAAATLLALICTESPRVKVTHDDRVYWVAAGDRALPQGACTSPTLSNLVSRKLDRRLAGAAKKLGWTYTRYADDLTFSGDAATAQKLALLFARVRHIVQEEGFVVNEKKGRVQRKARRQAVTGVVVNDKLSVPRDEVRRLRAILHRAKTTGLAAQNRDNRPDFDAYVRGKIAYIAMIDAAKAQQLLRSYQALPR